MEPLGPKHGSTVFSPSLTRMEKNGSSSTNNHENARGPTHQGLEVAVHNVAQSLPLRQIPEA